MEPRLQISVTIIHDDHVCGVIDIWGENGGKEEPGQASPSFSISCFLWRQ